MVDVHVPNLYIIIIPFITRWRFDWNVHIMYMLSNQGVGLGGWLQQIFNAKWKSLEVRDEMMMMMMMMVPTQAYFKLPLGRLYDREKQAGSLFTDPRFERVWRLPNMYQSW